MTDTREILQRLNEHTLLLRALVAIVEEGIADQLSPVPLTAAQLASAGGLHPDTLYRLLRFAASFGFFREDEEGRFHLTTSGQALRADVPGSLRERLRGPWQELLWRSYDRVPQMLRTGATAFDAAHGKSFFEYLAAYPEINRLFDQSMARLSQVENPVIAANYPFGDYRRVIDVGGGQGGLLAAVLAKHPGISAVLFDQPQVIAAPEALSDRNFTGRWQAIAGDFMQAVPPGGDVYVLKRILHDWDDRQALVILGACRAALTPDARLLVIDAVMKPGNEPDPNKFMDVNMMALTGGRERTAAEFRQLVERAGLEMRRVLALPAPATVSIVETRLA